MKPKIRKNRTLNRQKLKTKTKNSNIFLNKDFLIKLWELIFFSSISILLIITYLNQAWRPIDKKHLLIKGLSGISKNDIEKASNIFLKKNLLELNPKEIEAYLLNKLPIKAISVNRKFFPPGLNLNILEREPIAFANRISSNKVENGMIDLEGYWIPIQFVNESKKNKIKIYIEDWDPNQKEKVKQIIKNRFKLDSPLHKIKLNPLQEISIKTEHFDSVLLGSDIDRLIEQINKLNQLQKSLPNLLINTKVKIVDLRDPSKPELKTEKILSN